ncbi:hypothetical protein ACFL0L_02375 [Patescibacteria group bacterium]
MKKFFAVILILLFIILTPAAMVVHSLRTVILDPEIIKQELVDASAYEAAIDLTAEELQSQSGLFDDAIPFLTSEDITDAIRGVISPAQLQTQVESLIDQFFIWLDSSDDIRDIELIVSLGEVKTRTESIVLTTLEARYNELPICLPDQLIDTEFDNKNVDVIGCHPSDVTFNDLIQDIDITSLLDEIPDEINIIELLSEGEEVVDEQFEEGSPVSTSVEDVFNQLNNIRDRLSQATRLLQTLLVVILLIFLFIGALSTRSVRGFFGWTGFPLLIVGLILIVPMLVAGTYISDTLERELSSPDTPIAAQTFMRDMGESFVDILASSVRTKGIILGSLGFIFIIVAFSIPASKEPKKKRLAPPEKKKLTLNEKLGREEIVGEIPNSALEEKLNNEDDNDSE